MKRPIYYSPFLLIILLPLFYGQTLPALSSLSLDELEQKSRDKRLPREEQTAYLDALIKKAKQNGDSLRLADAYHYLCSDFHAYTEKAVAYADSLIEMTKHWNHKTYPAHAYLQKGIQLFALAKYFEALENFLIAKAFFVQQRDKLGQLRVKNAIATIKIATNQEKEALALFKQNLAFFDNKDHQINYHQQYLNSLYALAYAYNTINVPDSAEILSCRGIIESRKSKNKLYPLFLIEYGDAKRLKNQPDLAIDTLFKGVRLIKEKQLSKQTLCNAFLIFGDVYLSQGDTLSSIAYLEKVDSIYKKEPQVIAQAEEAYSKLYTLYKAKREEKKQNRLTDQLLKIETILKKDRHDELSKGLAKAYETSKTLSEKENAITKLEKQSNNYILWIWILAVFCIALVIGVTFYLRLRSRINKKRFKELMEKQAAPPPRSKTKTNGERKKEVELSDKLIDEILSKLQRFEDKKGYLDQKLSVYNLAKKLKTNVNYLSNIVNIYKEKSFPQYVNDLRIDYAVRQLKSKSRLRKYTITALAEEFGFNTAVSFTRAFEKKTEIRPSYFIEQHKKTVK